MLRMLLVVEGSPAFRFESFKWPTRILKSQNILFLALIIIWILPIILFVIIEFSSDFQCFSFHISTQTNSFQRQVQKSSSNRSTCRSTVSECSKWMFEISPLSSPSASIFVVHLTTGERSPAERSPSKVRFLSPVLFGYLNFSYLLLLDEKFSCSSFVQP